MSTMPSKSQQGKGFVRNFVGVSLGNYGAIALSFALNVILTRTLGAEQFGRLALLIMAVQILGCVISNWTLTALVRFGSQEFVRSGSLAESFWARACIVVPWLLVAATVLAIVREPAAAYLTIPVWALWVVFGYFLLSNLLLTVGAVFQACQRMDHYAVTLFMDKALAILGILFLPSALAHDPVMILVCYALSSLFVSIWAVAMLGLDVFLPVRVTSDAVRSLWRFSVPMIISTWVIIFGAQWIDFAVIKHYRPFADLGLYSLASQVAGVVQQITIISSSLLLPHFSVLIERQQQSEIKTIVEKAMPYGFLGFSVLLSAMVLFAPVGIPVIFGPNFAGAVWPLTLLMVATMGLALFNTFSPLISAHGSNWSITGILLVSVSVNLIANLLLIPSYGINGAAVARALAYAIAAAMMLALIQNRFGVATLRYGVLGIPILMVVLSSMFFDGVYFYLVGLIGMIGSAYMLVSMFGLFCKDDLAVLARSNMPLFIKSGLTKVFAEKAG